MPWSDNRNGGGWQGGPWGQPPRGGGPRRGRGGGGGGPDFEDMLRKGRDQLRGFRPGRLGPLAVAVLVLALAAIWLATGFYQVDASERGVEQRFGAFSVETGQGLNYHFPWPIETVTIVNTTEERRIEIGGSSTRGASAERLMLTGDENIIELSFYVAYVVDDARSYVFNMRDPEASVKPVAESAMREAIGRADLERIQTTGRGAIAAEVQRLVQETLDQYGGGVRITRVEIQDAEPPTEVAEAFRDVQAANQDKETKRNEGLAYQNQKVPEARGEAERIRNQAEAYRERVIAEANGEAERFTLIYEEYAKARDVTRRRMYLETMERVLADMEKVVVDDDVGGGVVPYLPLPEVQRRRGDGGGR